MNNAVRDHIKELETAIDAILKWRYSREQYLTMNDFLQAYEIEFERLRALREER